MSDGPYRNLPLNASWRQYAKEAQATVATDEERQQKLRHAAVQEFMSPEFSKPLDILRNELQNQARLLPFDPIGLVQDKLAQLPQSEFVQFVNRELESHQHQQTQPNEAIVQVIEAYAEQRILASAKNAISGEYYAAFERKDASKAQLNAILDHTKKDFGLSLAKDIAKAVLDRDRKRFKSIANSIGTDDGPML